MRRDNEDDQRLSLVRDLIYPDRRNLVGITNSEISDLNLGSSVENPPPGIIEDTKSFLAKSQKDREAFEKKKGNDQLSRPDQEK